MKRREFLLTVPALVATPSFGQTTGSAPIWSDAAGFSIQQGKTYALGALCSDPQGLPLVFSALSTLPYGVFLDKSSGTLTVSTQTATGNYGIRFRAFNGLIASDSPFYSLSIGASAVVQPPPPAVQGSLIIKPSFNFKKDLYVSAGVFWNKYQVDNRGGIIGWCDGDHAEPSKIVLGEADANSIRYFNTSNVPFHGIPANSVGYLVAPALTGKGAKVSDYDNYHWWYVPSEDKFFWIFSAEFQNGGRHGIFDLEAGAWSHGNDGLNKAAWPNGPYWGQYVSTDGALKMTIVKNAPNGFSEALDKAVAVSREHLFIIERNPAHPSSSGKPWRIFTPSIAGKPYAIKTESHNQYMNSGVCVGEWLYFIRPATNAEKAGYPDPRSREFWKVRLRPPYDQYKKLASFPIFDIIPVQNMASGKNDNPSWGPLLVHDEDSNSILCIYERLWVYDIDADTWTNQTPSGYQRVLSAVGGMVKSKREIVFRPGSNVDKSGAIDGHSAAHYWSKLALSAGQKPRARWVPRVMDRAYPGSGAPNPWGGKHTRFIYSDIVRRVDGTVENGGYVWQFGGDYKGVPYTSSESVPNYPKMPGGWAMDSGRQDQYRAPVEEVQGKVVIEMSCNHVAFYPYKGGTPSASIQFGPGHPDGIGVVFDKRGDAWVGPGYYRFQLKTEPASAGSIENAMYRFRLPNRTSASEDGVGGIRKGNAWTKPAQTAFPGVKTQFTGSSMWSAYDHKKDAVVFATVAGGDPWKYYVFEFPCIPAGGVHAWKRTLVQKSQSAWTAFANSITRNGAQVSATGGVWSGAQAVIGDYLYALTIQGGVPPANSTLSQDQWHRDANVTWLTKVNLHNYADIEYIPLPTHLCRGFDAPIITQQPPDAGPAQTMNEIREIQALGHLIVLSPPAVHYQTNEPWLYWYNTNTGSWTAGQTWDQMKKGTPSLPSFPGISRGKMCCVPETGEVWYMTGWNQAGVVKYRIW
ncbi:MAG: hypothetical protein IT532_15115 [Burkholderiales bacterium]|nr:hypothetical protein [Burkholderiales bacterium]